MSLATLDSSADSANLAAIREKAMEAISKLPPFSPVLNKLIATLADDSISFVELAAVIEKDTVLAGAVLRMCNSAFYARRGTVNSVKQAVSVLGVDKLRNMSISMSLARMWNSAALPKGWSSREFNLHAAAAAILSDQVAVELNSDYAEGAFAAGLLQNVGMVLIAIGIPDVYRSIVEAYQSGTGGMDDYEAGYAGVTHAELSGEVLKRWHLPAPIAEAVLRHHGPHAHDVAHPLSRMVELGDKLAEQHGILAQPWMRPWEGRPEEALERVGLGARTGAILANFRGEFDTIKSYFG